MFVIPVYHIFLYTHTHTYPVHSTSPSFGSRTERVKIYNINIYYICVYYIIYTCVLYNI